MSCTYSTWFVCSSLLHAEGRNLVLLLWWVGAAGAARAQGLSRLYPPGPGRGGAGGGTRAGGGGAAGAARAAEGGRAAPHDERGRAPQMPVEMLAASSSEAPGADGEGQKAPVMSLQEAVADVRCKIAVQLLLVQVGPPLPDTAWPYGMRFAVEVLQDGMSLHVPWSPDPCCVRSRKVRGALFFFFFWVVQAMTEIYSMHGSQLSNAHALLLLDTLLSVGSPRHSVNSDRILRGRLPGTPEGENESYLYVLSAG